MRRSRTKFLFFSLVLALILRLFVLNNELEINFVPSGWQNFATDTREQFVGTYEEVLPQRQANLLSGIVLGNVGLDRHFKSQLANVGLTHIVAASGMNVTLVSAGIFWGLSLLRVGKRYKVILSMLFILFYSTITGFEPPIVRATLMIFFTYIATLVGRQNNGLVGLLLSAYIMLWASPKLLTGASFLLSFAAMMSQIFLGSFSAPLLSKQSLLAGFLSGIKTNFWQSFLATLFTFPVVLWFFAKFSLVSLLSNVLVLWTIEPLMILGGLLGLLGSFGSFVALVASPILSYFLWVVDILGQDVFLFKFRLASPLFVVGYYLVLGGFVWWWNFSKKSVD